MSYTLIDERESVNSLAHCKTAIKEIEQGDRETIVDDSSSRLYSTWLSQECEVRAGPEYIIRKYTFFENGTFLLLRYHYAEESCSIPTHTITIRGFLKLLGSSAVVSGATETNFHVDVINIIPLNRQVAHKFGHRLNLTCGPRPKWRPYVSEIVYEQSWQRSAATSLWQGPIYNSLQTHSFTKKRLGINCLEPFGIEFTELRLLRVQKKSFRSSFGYDRYHKLAQFQLFLASPAPNVYSRWNYKPTSLQSTAMIRIDTASSCPICSGVSRSTEFSPPLLHQTAALPALIGGYWHSERCESSEGGIWLRRQFQIYSGDRLWTGRWDYYDDPQCWTFLYALTAAGSYVQRAGRQRRHEEIDRGEIDFLSHSLNVSTRFLRSKRSITDSPTIRTLRNNLNVANEPRNEKWSVRMDNKVQRQERSLTDGVHQLLHDEFIIESRFTTMLRDRQIYDKITTKKPFPIWNTLSGTSELDLHIAESTLMFGDVAISTRCSIDRERLGVPLTTWPRNCVPRTIEAPSTLRLRVKLDINWNGQYILLLGSQDDNLWEAPLRQCAQISPHNSILRAHLRRSVGLRFGLFSSASTNRISEVSLISQVFLCFVYYLVW
ncbi:protein APCDD1 isoform X2 [Monomorium pharaonis]|nr:protein APCDD1 isoform X2 [Monomorium pharaonis]